MSRLTNLQTAQPLHPGGDFYPDGKFTPDQHNLVSPELDQHGDHENNFTFDSEGNILNDLVFDSFRINQDFVDSIVAGNRHVGFDNLMPEHIEIQKPSRSSGELEHGQMDVTMSGAINHNGSQI